MQVREYKPDDFSEVIHLWAETGLGNDQRGDNAEVIEHTLASGGKLLILESDENTIAGTSWLTNDGRRTYLHHFCISAKYQGKGLSKLLLAETLKLAKGMGMQIKIEVHRRNLHAIELYRNAGFSYLGDYLVYIIRDVELLSY